MVERWKLSNAPKKKKGDLLTFDPAKRKPRSAIETFRRKRDTSPPAVIDLSKKRRELSDEGKDKVKRRNLRKATLGRRRESAREVLTDLANMTGFDIVDDSDRNLVEKAARRMSLMARNMDEVNKMETEHYETDWQTYVGNVQRALRTASTKVGSELLLGMSSDIDRIVRNCKEVEAEVTEKLRGAGILPAPLLRFFARRGWIEDPGVVEELKIYQHFLLIAQEALLNLKGSVNAAAAARHKENGAPA